MTDHNAPTPSSPVSFTQSERDRALIEATNTLTDDQFQVLLARLGAPSHKAPPSPVDPNLINRHLDEFDLEAEAEGRAIRRSNHIRRPRRGGGVRRETA